MSLYWSFGVQSWSHSTHNKKKNYTDSFGLLKRHQPWGFETRESYRKKIIRYKEFLVKKSQYISDAMSFQTRNSFTPYEISLL